MLRVIDEVDLAPRGVAAGTPAQIHVHQLRGVVLDCTEASFLASCGIDVLVENTEQARAERSRCGW